MRIVNDPCTQLGDLDSGTVALYRESLNLSEAHALLDVVIYFHLSMRFRISSDAVIVAQPKFQNVFVRVKEDRVAELSEKKLENVSD